MPDFNASEHGFMQSVGSRLDCPSPELLLARNQGVLPPDVESMVQKHVDECELCQMLLKDLSLVQAPEFEQRLYGGVRSVTSVMRWIRLGTVCIAVLALIAAGFFLKEEKAHRNVVIATPVSAASSQGQPSSGVMLEKLDPPAVIASPPVSTKPTAPTEAELQSAFAVYRQNKYQEATESFSALSERYPESGIVFLYLGVSELFLDRDQDALAALGRAQAIVPKDLEDAANWYHAVAALRLQDADSLHLFQQLCRNPASRYSGQACVVVKQLQS